LTPLLRLLQKLSNVGMRSTGLFTDHFKRRLKARVSRKNSPVIFSPSIYCKTIFTTIFIVGRQLFEQDASLSQSDTREVLTQDEIQVDFSLFNLDDIETQY